MTVWKYLKNEIVCIVKCNKVVLIFCECVCVYVFPEKRESESRRGLSENLRNIDILGERNTGFAPDEVFDGQILTKSI